MGKYFFTTKAQNLSSLNISPFSFQLITSKKHPVKMFCVFFLVIMNKTKSANGTSEMCLKQDQCFLKTSPYISQKCHLLGDCLVLGAFAAFKLETVSFILSHIQYF